MSTIARDPIKPIMMVVALGYVMMLAAALIWLHLSPLIVLGMTVGGVALAACTLRPILAIHGLIMLLHCQAVLARSDVGGLAAKGMGVVIVLSWLLNMAVNRKRRMQIDGLLMTMMLFVLWSGLLIMVSIEAGTAIGRTMTFFQLVIGAAMFSTIIDSRTRLRGVYRIIVAWTTFSALIGIAQYLSGMPEAVGLIGNRNAFAMYVNIALVCAYLLHQSVRGPLEKMMLAMSIPVLFLALALTFSRAGLIVLGVAMALVFAKAARERRFQILIASSVLIILIAVFLPAAFWSRAGSIVPSIQRQENSFGLRVGLWKAGIRMVADHPISGVGPGNFRVALPRYGRGAILGARLGAHNSYVSVAAEMGIVGLTLFLLLHIMALKRIRRRSAAAARSGDTDVGLLALTAETCILIIMLSALSGHLESTKYLWIFFGLAMAIGRLSASGTGRGGDVASDNDDHALSSAVTSADM
jgi:O-antigen ligase